MPAEYQYKQVATDSPPGSEKFLNELDELGQDGWELITVVTLWTAAERKLVKEALPDSPPDSLWLLIFLRRRPK